MFLYGVTGQSDAILALYIIYILGMFIPSLAVSVRRLHDVGKSGATLFLGLIPIIGGLYLLYLFVKDGDLSFNEYGANPKSGLMDY